MDPFQSKFLDLVPGSGPETWVWTWSWAGPGGRGGEKAGAASRAAAWRVQAGGGAGRDKKIVGPLEFTKSWLPSNIGSWGGWLS